jgi:hypothetical protein
MLVCKIHRDVPLDLDESHAAPNPDGRFVLPGETLPVATN